MRASFALLLLFASAAMAAGDTYTWVDENNERHWSDTPHEGAQKVDLTPQNGYRAPPLVTAPARAATAGNAPAPTAISCAITQPGPDQVLFEVESVTISVRVTPPAGPDAVVSATLDGGSLSPAGAGATDFVVTPVDRGTHVAAAVVRDGNGRTLCTAPAVTFHVRQHSVVRPR
jgi:azurin